MPMLAVAALSLLVSPTFAHVMRAPARVRVRALHAAVQSPATSRQMEECIVHGESAACIEPMHAPTYARMPDVALVATSVRECLAEAESFVEQQDCLGEAIEYSAIAVAGSALQAEPLREWLSRRWHRAMATTAGAAWLLRRVLLV
jgi:hypothetical protein